MGFIRQASRERRSLLLLTAGSYYFLSVDILADLRLLPRLSPRGFTAARGLYLLAMAAGFWALAPLRRSFSPKSPLRGLIPLGSLASLWGMALLPRAGWLPLLAAVNLFTAGILGAAVYSDAAGHLGGNPFLGRLCALGMGAAALLQAVTAALEPPPALFAAVLTAAFCAALALLVPGSDAGRRKSGTDPDRAALPPGLRPAAQGMPRDALFLTGVALISLMGGLNDGTLTALQAEGEVALYTLPRLLYFGGMALSGIVADRAGFRGLSLTVLLTMILSTGGALLMASPATAAVNAGIYSLFAGIVIIYFTVPLFASSAPEDLDRRPSLGRAVRLPALALGTVVYDLALRPAPLSATTAVYVVLSALLTALFILSGQLTETRPAPLPAEAGAAAAKGRTAGTLTGTADPAAGGVMTAAGTPMGISGTPAEETGTPEAAEADGGGRLRRFSGRFALTPREEQVLSAVLESDLPTGQLAQKLHMSERTMYRHLTGIYEKTGVDSRMGLLILYHRGEDDAR